MKDKIWSITNMRPLKNPFDGVILSEAKNLTMHILRPFAPLRVRLLNFFNNLNIIFKRLFIPIFIFTTIILFPSFPFYAEEKRENDWKKECHPFILFSVDKVSVIKERVTREPYKGWFSAVKGSVDNTFSTDFSKITDERHKTNLAKNSAFAWLITGEEKYAKQTMNIIRQVKLKEDGGDWTEQFLAEDDGLTYLCLAYDFLYAYLLNQPEENRFFRKVIFRQSQRHRDYFLLWYLWHQNNHQTRHYGALCLGAMTIAEENLLVTKEWFQFGKNWFDKSFEVQSCDGKAWAEGHNYFEYSAGIHLIYQFALKNRFGIDEFSKPEIKSLHEWSLRSRLPNGHRPNFDDANFSYFPSHYFTSVYQPEYASMYVWDWENMDIKNWPGFDPIYAICLFDDTVKSKEPPFQPTWFNPEGGNVVFKSDWGKDAVYLHALGENGKPRINGAGHEQPDNTSFILYAFGEMLALDGGYINWENREKVFTADNHNLILVDGKGPKNNPLIGALKSVDEDAYIRNTVTTNTFEYCEIDIQHNDTDIKRCILFIDKTFFLIADFCKSKSKHQYTFLLHGNGGGDTGNKFELQKVGGRWIGKKAKLDWLVFAPEKLKFSTRLDEHSSSYGQVNTHTVLEASQSGFDCLFISLLLPTKLSDVAAKKQPYAIGRPAFGGNDNFTYEYEQLEGKNSIKINFNNNDYQILFGTVFSNGFAVRKKEALFHKICENFVLETTPMQFTGKGIYCYEPEKDELVGYIIPEQNLSANYNIEKYNLVINDKYISPKKIINLTGKLQLKK